MLVCRSPNGGLQFTAVRRLGYPSNGGATPGGGKSHLRQELSVPPAEPEVEVLIRYGRSTVVVWRNGPRSVTVVIDAEGRVKVLTDADFAPPPRR